MITQDELEAAVTAGTEILGKLRAEFPALKAYLVLAYRGQQMDITSNPLEILVTCGEMVMADAASKQILKLLAEKERLESTGATRDAVMQVSRDLSNRAKALRFVPEVQIELRLGDLRYDLVWALQAHPLVNKMLTPQTKASIRIVLGNLGTLSRADGARQP